MESFEIRGGNLLEGTIEVSGSKNAALPIMAACLLSEGPSTLHRIPALRDVDSMSKLLGELGCHIYRNDPIEGITPAAPKLGGPLTIEVTDEKNCEARYDIVTTMRASICVLGPLLAKRGRAVVSLPGGCAIGNRPVDLHIQGLEKLGARFSYERGNIIGDVWRRLKGCRLHLRGPRGSTVLGTINVMSAATLAEGTTVITGAACEPEVVATARFLNQMGAHVSGMGTSEITIEGVDKLTGCETTMIPDRIEAATYLMLAAMTAVGPLTIARCNPDHLTGVMEILHKMGIKTSCRDGNMTVTSKAGDTLNPVTVCTQPYPGFPTDLQAQLMALTCLCEGQSHITETVFPDRFLQIGELNRLGANIHKEVSMAIIQSIKRFNGARVMASDLRASIALVMAGLEAQGTTHIDRIYHIDRGYEKIDAKLRAVGADIRRVNNK